MLGVIDVLYAVWCVGEKRRRRRATDQKQHRSAGPTEFTSQHGAALACYWIVAGLPSNFEDRDRWKRGFEPIIVLISGTSCLRFETAHGSYFIPNKQYISSARRAWSSCALLGKELAEHQNGVHMYCCPSHDSECMASCEVCLAYSKTELSQVIDVDVPCIGLVNAPLFKISSIEVSISYVLQ